MTWILTLKKWNIRRLNEKEETICTEQCIIIFSQLCTFGERKRNTFQKFTSHIKRELSLASGLRQEWALKHLDLRYSKVMGLGQTVFRTFEVFSLVIIPHDLGIAYTLMNQKTKKIGLILLSSKLIFL